MNENNPYEVIAFEQGKVRALNEQLQAEERKYNDLAIQLRNDQTKFRGLLEDFERLKKAQTHAEYRYLLGEEAPRTTRVLTTVPIFKNGQLLEKFPWGPGKFWKERNDKVGAYIPAGASVLDLGGGFSHLAEHVSGRYLSLDRERWTNVTELANFEFNLYPEVGYFDVLVCQGTLEYLSDPLRFLKTIRKYGSQLFITYQLGETTGVQGGERRNALEFVNLLGLLLQSGWKCIGQQQLDDPSQLLFICEKVPMPGEINAYWWGEGQTKNWGDIFTEFIFRQRFGKYLTLTDPAHAELFGCGSILEHIPQGYTGYVVGAGVQYARTHVDLTKAKVLALRGKLTYNRCALPAGHNNLLLGDPGLLAFLFSPPRTSEYEVGIIPHYADAASGEVAMYATMHPGTLVIDIESGVQEVINQVAKCKKIVSSSLHGLVLADALNIPNRWVKLSDSVGGSGFKFADYYSAFDEYVTPAFSIADAVESVQTRNTDAIKSELALVIAENIK